MSKRSFPKKDRFYKSSMTSKLIFSVICKKKYIDKKFTHIFLRVFMIECTSRIVIFLYLKPCQRSPTINNKTLKSSKITDITPPLTSCYPTSRRKLHFHWIGPIGRFSHWVAMSVCVCVCVYAPSCVLPCNLSLSDIKPNKHKTSIIWCWLGLYGWPKDIRW